MSDSAVPQANLSLTTLLRAEQACLLDWWWLPSLWEYPGTVPIARTTAMRTAEDSAPASPTTLSRPAGSPPGVIFGSPRETASTWSTLQSERPATMTHNQA